MIDKSEMKEGMLVEMLYMEDERPIEKYTLGFINRIDDIGQIHVTWENGRELAICDSYGDEFRVYPEDEFGVEQLMKYSFRKFRSGWKESHDRECGMEAPCFAEFITNEFRDADIMKGILGKIGFSLYENIYTGL